MSRIVEDWILVHEGEYETRADCIRACAAAVGRHYDTVDSRLRAMERAGEIAKKGRTRPSPGGASALSPSTSFSYPPAQRMNIQGIPREQARLKHDVPARLEHRLSEFLDSMSPGIFYEEPTVLRACNVAKDDDAYWNQITSSPRYTKFHGITEKGIRLWGLEDDMRWAAREMNGFVRSI